MVVTDNYVFFWKDRLAQWPTWFFTDENGVRYQCGEQYMMAHKALLFGDTESYEKIMLETSPREQQNLGRGIKNFSQPIWDAMKYTIVFRGNFLRFSQNEDLMNVLRKHKGKTFVEASPIDLVWGVGLDENDVLIEDSKNWRGENLLGKIFTELSEKLV